MSNSLIRKCQPLTFVVGGFFAFQGDYETPRVHWGSNLSTRIPFGFRSDSTRIPFGFQLPRTRTRTRTTLSYRESYARASIELVSSGATGNGAGE